VVEDGWPLRRAAERFQVAPTTAKRWADRYRQHGPAGMTDHPAARTTALVGCPYAPSGASCDCACGSGSAPPASPPGCG
jgi:hypothetical protein